MFKFRHTPPSQKIWLRLLTTKTTTTTTTTKQQQQNNKKKVILITRDLLTGLLKILRGNNSANTYFFNAKYRH